MNRRICRILLGFLLSLGLVVLIPLIPKEVKGGNSQAIVKGVEAIGMTVQNLDRSIDFYSKILSFEKVSDVELMGSNIDQLQGVFALRIRVVQMRLGDEFIELTEYLTPKGRPIPLDSRSYDHWFQHIAVIVNDMDRAYKWLYKNKVQHISPAPQRLPNWNKNAGGIWAFYFSDPDGHPLEILQFPPDKGAKKWHIPNKKLFLGIDHTAIVVENTEKSLEFYRDQLGFTVAGNSENYGPEQEHLNNVFGARLRITGLRSETGPGIEFLEYITPRGGLPIPNNKHSNDLIHWQTNITTKNIEKAAQRIMKAGIKWISPGVVTLKDNSLGFSKGFMVQDPDGHVIRLMER